MSNIWDSISRNFIKWALGVIGVLMVAAITGGFKFYMEWSTDEAAEDAVKEAEKSLMFDSTTQKEEIKDHVIESPSALEQQVKIIRDADFQKQVLKELREMRKMDTLNADQIYQIKQQLKPGTTN